MNTVVSFPLIELLEKLETGSRPKGGVAQITEGVPSIGGEHLDPKGGFRFHNLRYVPNSFFTGMNRGRIRRQDILVVKDGATTGKTSFVSDQFPFETATINEHVFLLRPNRKKVLPRFLFYYLYSSGGQQQILSCFQGSAIGGIPQGFARTTKVPVPPLPDQERIVAILDAAEDLRRLREQADRRTADLIPALFHEMFGDPAINDRHWVTVKIESVFPKDRAGTRCGPFGSALKRYEYVENGIPVWGIDNVKSNKFVEEGSLFITEEKYSGLKNYSVESGDILISRAGTVGRLCVARPTKHPSIIGTNLIRLSLEETKIVPDYVASLFTYFGDRMGRLRATSDDNAYSFVQTNTLKSLSIPLPPLPLQKEFKARLAEIRAMEASQASSRRRLDDLFQSLLHRAFQGEL